MKARPTHNPELAFIKENWPGNPLNELGQYVNLDGPSEKGLGDLLKWQFGPKPMKQLKKNQQTNVAVETNSNLLRDRNDGITWFGHTTFLFTMAGKHLITDPVFYNVSLLKRYTDLPLAVKELNSIDYILLSHNHRDHCDERSLKELCAYNPDAVILTGLGLSAILRKWRIENPVIEAGWYQAYHEMGDIAITYLPAKHWNRRGFTDLNEMLWGSFMIEYNHKKIYFGADSGLGCHFEEIGLLYPGIDYAFIGIGAYEPNWFMRTSHTGPADALEAVSMLKAKHFIPMHYGTFDLSDEPIFYPLSELQQLVTTRQVDGVRPMSIGDKLLL
ncbi:MAG TPA: MBL fold metallo-hydrolase [Panacibacter sp.]|nr:MBL fold metallo-hydrolase [Panacibacter sp.]HNP44267.1 MBL fold metallo-hydrolase [Panacibacter sp.]